MVGMFLPLSPVTPSQLGSDAVINSLPGLVTSVADRFDYMALTPTFAFSGRVFAAYVSLFLPPGIDSWGSAFELLDPTGYNMQNGQANVANMIGGVFNHMIQQNYAQGVYHFTRAVLQNPPQAIVNPPEAIVLTLWIGIVTY